MRLPEALDPLGQRLRTPTKRRVDGRFVSAPRLVAGHDALGQGVLGEVGAQACHGAGEGARVYADERALFCPGQLFLTVLHGSGSFRLAVCRRENKGKRPGSTGVGRASLQKPLRLFAQISNLEILPAASATGVHAIVMPCGPGQDVLMLDDVLQRLSRP
jgi:hypothetical protein